MSVEAMQVLTALLALCALVLAVLVLAGRLLRGTAPWVDELMAAVDDAAVWLAFLVAAVAMGGSLYFSEVADFEPCRLCWFQRIAMYPLAVILLVAAIRRDRAVRWYVAPIAAAGALVSGYHYLIEWRPGLEGGACGAFGPRCSVVWFREFGFVTLPFMALCGFAAIIVFVFATAHDGREPATTAERLES